jgi:hypothetical protein
MLILPDRRYRMKCGDCECTYILTASSDEEKKCENNACKSCCRMRTASSDFI